MRSGNHVDNDADRGDGACRRRVFHAKSEHFPFKVSPFKGPHHHTKHPRTSCGGYRSNCGLVDLDGFDDHILDRAVHPAGLYTGDLINHLARGFIGDLTENGVAVVQPWCCVNRDEELRTVRTWARVRHREEVRAVELQFRVEFIVELEAGATGAGAGGITTLDHETRDDAVEDRTVVKRALVGTGRVLRGVLTRTGCQARDCLDGVRGMVAKKINHDVPVVGVERNRLGLLRHATQRTRKPQGGGLALRRVQQLWWQDVGRTDELDAKHPAVRVEVEIDLPLYFGRGDR